MANCGHSFQFVTLSRPVMDDIVLPVIIRPFLSLFEVLGINSPFPRRWRYFLGISANLFFLTLLLLYYQQYHAVDKNHQFMEYFNDGIQLIVTEAAIMIVFLETIHKHRKYMRFFREVSQFNSSCRQMNVDVDTFYTGSIRAFARQFVVLVAGSTVVEALIILNIAIDQQWVVYWHVNILPLSLVRLRQLQLSYFLRFPSVHLKVLEDLLKRFVKVTNKRQAHKKEFVEGINRRLCELKRLHGIVLHEMRIFNEIFSYSLAFHLLQNFVELLSGSYWLYYYNLDNHCVFGKYVVSDDY